MSICRFLRAVACDVCARIRLDISTGVWYTPLKGVIMPQEVSDKNYAEITASCSKVLSYFHLQNNISPIKRLYVKNSSDTERENITIRIHSEPKFLLPCEINDRLARKTLGKMSQPLKRTVSRFMRARTDSTACGVLSSTEASPRISRSNS